MTKQVKKSKTVKQVGVPLTKIAAEVKMNPKNARAKMRRLEVPKGLTIGDGWTFNAKGAAWAKAQLKRDLRKAA